METTMSKCGFSELSSKDEEATNGGVNWRNWAIGVAEGAGGCIIGTVCPEVGIAFLVDGTIRSFGALGEN